MISWHPRPIPTLCIESLTPRQRWSEVRCKGLVNVPRIDHLSCYKDLLLQGACQEVSFLVPFWTWRKVDQSAFPNKTKSRKRMWENGRGWKHLSMKPGSFVFVWPKWNTKAPLSVAMDPTQAAPKRDWQFLICIGIFWMRGMHSDTPKSTFHHGNVLWHVIACKNILRILWGKDNSNVKSRLRFIGSVIVLWYLWFMIMNPVGFMPTALLVNEFVWVPKATGSWMVFVVAFFSWEPFKT